MQTVRFDKKEDSDVIDIDDVVEDGDKIYCSQRGDILWFLVKVASGNYRWWNMKPTSLDSNQKYDTFKDALVKCNKHNWKVLIFDSQCEVLEYAKKM